MECVICTGPLTYGHMGINSCRACSVFYKRTIASKDQLKCRNGDKKCMQLNSKTSCRLCRFMKIDNVLKKAVGDTDFIIPEKIVEMELGPSTFLSHESIYDCEPSTYQTPTLNRLRKGYSLMCQIRLSGEVGCNNRSNEQTEIRVGSMIFVPSTYDNYPRYRNLAKEAMKTFASHGFDDFRDLDEECKEFITGTSLGMMIALDSAYRVSHYFPNEDDMRVPGYTTYVRERDLLTFFSNSPDNIDSAKMAGDVKKSLDDSVNVAKKYFKRVKPRDYEFLALLGLALWNSEISNLNEKVMKIVSRNRSVIMKELHSYYAQQGIPNYAVRIGHLHCIIVNFQNNVARLHGDFEFYRLNNLFKQYIDINSQ